MKLVAFIAFIFVTMGLNTVEGSMVDGSTTGPDTLVYVYSRDTLTDRNCHDNGNGCTSISLGYPEFANTGEPILDSIRSTIVSWLSSTTIGADVHRTVRSVMEEFIVGYRQYAEESDFTNYPCYSSSSVTVTANTTSLVCLELAGQSYTGGAHGNAFVNYSLFEKPAGKKIDWQVLFSPDTKDSVRSIAESIFRTNAQMADDETYQAAGYWFEDDLFVLNENAGVSSEGLIFYYNNYEIAPYVYGATEILIPFSSLSRWIPESSPLHMFIPDK